MFNPSSTYNTLTSRVLEKNVIQRTPQEQYDSLSRYTRSLREEGHVDRELERQQARLAEEVHMQTTLTGPELIAAMAAEYQRLRDELAGATANKHEKVRAGGWSRADEAELESLCERSGRQRHAIRRERARQALQITEADYEAAAEEPGEYLMPDERGPRV